MTAIEQRALGAVLAKTVASYPFPIGDVMLVTVTPVAVCWVGDVAGTEGACFGAETGAGPTIGELAALPVIVVTELLGVPL